MKEKIEEILEKYDVETIKLVGVNDPTTMYVGEESTGILEELTTLIQEERKKDREMIYKDIQANYHITADEFYKHYLQSLDKGDTDDR